MQFRPYALGLSLACLAAACSERPTAPTPPAMDRIGPSMSRGSSGPAAQRAALLTDIPVVGTLPDGGSFTGTLTAKQITMDPATRQLWITGVLNGKATQAGGTVIDVVDQAFEKTTLDLGGTGTHAGLVHTASMVSCGILHLDLGPLHLDLLGLTVDLSEVILDVNAVTGAGNLLGNLLCALLGLLDLPGALAAITQILDTINNILAGLTTPGVGGVLWSMPAQGLQWSSV